MTGYHGQALLENLIDDVTAAWSLPASSVYMEQPRTVQSLPYAVVQFESMTQENAYPESVNSGLLQVYQFRVEGLFPRIAVPNLSEQQARLGAIIGGLSAEPAADISFERFVKEAELVQTEFESEPAWLVRAIVLYEVYEQL